MLIFAPGIFSQLTVDQEPKREPSDRPLRLLPRPLHPLLIPAHRPRMPLHVLPAGDGHLIRAQRAVRAGPRAHDSVNRRKRRGGRGAAFAERHPDRDVGARGAGYGAVSGVLYGAVEPLLGDDEEPAEDCAGRSRT